MTDDDIDKYLNVKKIASSIPVTRELIKDRWGIGPRKLSLIDHIHKMETDPEYRAECERLHREDAEARQVAEETRRADLGWFGRLKEDHGPAVLQRRIAERFPWRIVRVDKTGQEDD